MNIYQLKKMAKEMAKEYWDMDFNVPVVENGRLSNAFGRMCFKRNTFTGKITPTKLDIARRLLLNYSDETIISVLKHELTHWALAVQEKPFDDGHPVFERELQRVGGSSSFTIVPAGTLYTVICSKCRGERGRANTQGKLKKLVHGTRTRTWTSGCCGAKMEWGPTIYVEDANGEIANDQSRESQRAQRRAAMAAQTAVATAPATIKVPEPRKTFVPVIRSSNTSLQEILIPGPRGVTNKQMIPAIIAALESQRKDLVLELCAQYPEVFHASCKYLNKTYKSLYERVMWS